MRHKFQAVLPRDDTPHASAIEHGSHPADLRICFRVDPARFRRLWCGLRGDGVDSDYRRLKGGSSRGHARPNGV